MTDNDLDLLQQFTSGQSQDAFTALVNRHLHLVYSAALRQVRSPQLAEDVSQTVFSRLASEAARLRPNTILTAWLYQVTRHASVDVIRREARRQAREQIAFQMSTINDPTADWQTIEPVLDEAMDSLDEEDRTAILLRYFENKSLREIGGALGASEDAAQKRVGRALERLRDFFSKRKVTVSAGGLAALVSANAVQAAPAGMAVTVAASALVTSAGLATTTVFTLTQAIAMTTLQKTIVGATLVIAIAGGLYEASQARGLRAQVQTLQQEIEKQKLALASQKAAAPSPSVPPPETSPAPKANSSEVLKLRGQVAQLRQENVAIGSSSGLSKLTANPEARKMMRDQQKVAMSALYSHLSSSLKLSPEQKEQFNDLLADHIMDNVENVTTVLRDKLTPAQMDQLFASQDVKLQAQLQTLLGDEGVSKYQDYNKNILNNLSAEQFKGMMTGEGTDKDAKVRQLSDLIKQQAQAALASAGLPPDYQTVPTLDFRNIASETYGDRSISLLEDIYKRTMANAANILSPEEIKKFEEFTATAIKNNRYVLTLNRGLMAPVGN